MPPDGRSNNNPPIIIIILWNYIRLLFICAWVFKNARTAHENFMGKARKILLKSSLLYLWLRSGNISFNNFAFFLYSLFYDDHVVVVKTINPPYSFIVYATLYPLIFLRKSISNTMTTLNKYKDMQIPLGYVCLSVLYENYWNIACSECLQNMHVYWTLALFSIN